MSEQTIVKDWITKAGYRALVVLTRGQFHCGYVGIPADHPFYRKAYNTDAPQPITMASLADEPIGKRNAVDILCQVGNDVPSVGFLFDVHGGITFSDHRSEDSSLWWFGYDCAHSGDLVDYKVPGIEPYPGDVWRDLPYCEGECESLAEQLKKYA